MPLRQDPNRLSDPTDVLIARQKSYEEYYGPAVLASDSAGFFRIRSKLTSTVLSILVVTMLVGFFVTAILLHSRVFLVFWGMGFILGFVSNRIRMGVIYDFFPDSVYVYVPEQILLSPFSGKYEYMVNDMSDLRIRLRHVDRIHMHSVSRHDLLGQSILIITLDDYRPGRCWWLSAMLHQRRVMALMLKNSDADRALPLIQTYLYYKGS